MSTRTPYGGHPTRPKERAQLAPIGPAPVVEEPPETRPALEEAKAIARATEDDTPTQVLCGLCRGRGMVSPDVASTFDTLIANARERA